MKIKYSLALVVLVFSLIPMIIVNVYGKEQLMNNRKQSVLDSIELTSELQNNSINYYFNDIISNSNNFASQSSVVDLVDMLNDNDLSNEEIESNSLYLSVKLCIENYILSDNDIESICLVNNNNDIVIQSDNDYSSVINKLISTKEIQINNGLSEFFFNEEIVNKTPCFAYVNNIYDANNSKNGALIIIYNTNYIQNILRDTKILKSSHNMVVDFNGNILEFPYTQITSFVNNNKYAEIEGQISDLLANRESEILTHFEFNNVDKMAYSAGLNEANSIFVMIMNENELYTIANSVRNTMTTFVLLFAIIIIILCIVFVHLFTKPIRQMMYTLRKKQRGDKFVRFEVSANNEFLELSKAFNIMVDDISESEQRYRTVVEMSENIIFEYNIRKNAVKFTPNFNKKFSFRSKTEKCKDSFFVNCQVHPDDKENYNLTLKHAFQNTNYVYGEFRFKTIYGDYVWFLIKASMLYTNETIPYKIIGVMVDIDREKKSETRLLQRANYDSLTKLFNRETFEKHLENEYELAKMRKQSYAVLFLDLDDFKFYNDTYGHACGDEVLRFVADTLKNLIAKDGFAGRYGGDEFVACLNSHNSTDRVVEFAKNTIKVLKEGFTSNVVNKDISINCSIGISFLMESGKNLDTVIDEADEAMYKVKKHGKSNYSIYVQ